MDDIRKDNFDLMGITETLLNVDNFDKRDFFKIQSSRFKKIYIFEEMRQALSAVNWTDGLIEDTEKMWKTFLKNFNRHKCVATSQKPSWLRKDIKDKIKYIMNIRHLIGIMGDYRRSKKDEAGNYEIKKRLN